MDQDISINLDRFGDKRRSADGLLKHCFSPLSIFLVEDSREIRQFLFEVVDDIPGAMIIGYSESESDALAQLHSLACDILILDLELKEGNGVNLLRRLAKENIQPDLLKIIFSNNVNNTCRKVGAQYGVEFFFDKSNDFQLLQSLLRRLGEIFGGSGS